MSTLDLRPSPIAGTWYPGTPDSLAASVDTFLKEVDLPAFDGQILGVIVPHAGHRFSGKVAAHAFAALQGHTPELVAVISPFHEFSPYPLLTTGHDAYSTPLGEIQVDRKTLAEVQSHLDIPITSVRNDKEHSLEIELPFLQRVLRTEFKLLPIMMRAQDEETAQALGEALAESLADKIALLVASTDLSHFYDQKTANTLDQEMLKRFETLQPRSIFDAEISGAGFACGYAAVAAVMWAAKKLGADHVQTLNYATSGDILNDHSSVVGYGAAAILKSS